MDGVTALCSQSVPQTGVVGDGRRAASGEGDRERAELRRRGRGARARAARARARAAGARAAGAREELAESTAVALAELEGWAEVEAVAE